MSAKSLLQYAKQEVTKLKRDTTPVNLTTLDVVLVFDRSEEEMKRLTGYADFARELEKLGGEHTEANILEACEVSHFSRESIYFEDMDADKDKEPDEFHFPIKCTVSQAKNFIHRNKDNE